MCRKLLLVVLLIAPLGLYPFLRKSDVPEYDIKPAPAYQLSKQEELALHCLSIFPGQDFPAALPWEPLRTIGEDRSNEMRELAQNKPVQFLEMCLSKYEQEVKSYRVTFLKREKVNGNLLGAERIVVHFREKPFSVHMDWKEGAGIAFRSLYVEGENEGKILARIGFGGIGPLMPRAVDDPAAKAMSRFPITRFGLYVGAKQTLVAIQEAEKKGTLHLRFEGTERVPQLNHQLCYKFVRTPYSPPEDEGINELTFYIDPDTLLQVGSVLKDSDGGLIAEYFFRDVELNPTFSEHQFTKKSM